MNGSLNVLRDVVTLYALPGLKKEMKYTLNFKRGYYDDVKNNILTKDSMKRLIKIASEYDITCELSDKGNEKYEINLYRKVS